MLDFKKMLNGVSGSGVASGMAGGAISGVLAGSLMSKKGRKTAKKVLKAGGLAAAGALAWNAYSSYRRNAGQSADQPAQAGPQAHGGAPAPIVPRSQTEPRFQNLEARQFEAVWQEESDDSLLLIQAMISAGMADGQLDRAETEKIFQQVNQMELSMNQKARVLGELQKPMSASEIAGRVQRPETAIEVYAASLLAVDHACPEARQHLDTLAQELGLPTTLVDSLEQQGGQRPAPEMGWLEGDAWDQQRNWA
ncbi:MAG: DUF533 domain-containing protein [Xanthomonadales bacterium]|nr:DUF533 domain-containing protein [Xanthomonadales bacterium]